MFDDVEQEFIDKEKFLNTQNETLKGIRENFANLKDYNTVLERVQQILPRVQTNARAHAGAPGEGRHFSASVNEGRESAADQLIDGGEVQFVHVAGTIGQEEKEKFKKLIFRATRGLALTYFSDYKGNEDAPKSVYIVLF